MSNNLSANTVRTVHDAGAYQRQEAHAVFYCSVWRHEAWSWVIQLQNLARNVAELIIDVGLGLRAELFDDFLLHLVGQFAWLSITRTENFVWRGVTGSVTGLFRSARSLGSRCHDLKLRSIQ